MEQKTVNEVVAGDVFLRLLPVQFHLLSPFSTGLWKSDYLHTGFTHLRMCHGPAGICAGAWDVS